MPDQQGVAQRVIAELQAADDIDPFDFGTEGELKGALLMHREFLKEARAILAECDEQIAEGEHVVSTRDPYWDKDELQHFKQLVRSSKARRSELVSLFQNRLGLDIEGEDT